MEKVRTARAWKGAGLALVTATCFGAVEEPAKEHILLAQAAPTCYHWDHDPNHARYSWLLSLEADRSDQWLAGAAYFNNSFNQKCEYLFFGRAVWAQNGDLQGWYLKITGGVVMGYHGIYERKIPYNHDGVAPGLLPSIGYKRGRWDIQINVLGLAGLMATVGYDAAKW